MAEECRLAYGLHAQFDRMCSRRGGNAICGECIGDMDAPLLGFRRRSAAEWNSGGNMISRRPTKRSAQDSVGSFVADACYVEPGLRVKVSELYACYTRWCNSVGEEPIGKNAFGRELEAKGCWAKKSTKGVRLRVGLGIKEEFRDGGLGSMSDRGTVDPTRQGGGNSAPKRAHSSPPMSADEALRYVEANLRWRQIVGRANQATLALADEVIRLRMDAADVRLPRTMSTRYAQARKWLLSAVKRLEE